MANVIGRLVKAAEIGAQITPTDSDEILVVHPSTNEVNRARVGSVRGLDVNADVVTDIRQTDRFYIRRAGEDELQQIEFSAIDRALAHVITERVATAVTSRSIEHNLGVYPTYICVRNDGVEVIPSATFDTLNIITLTFDVPFVGVIQLHG